MSDTPETDAKIICSTHRSFKGVGGVVVSEFCRKLERERDEAREKLRLLEQAALAVVQRWEQPSWKDVEPTAAVINKLRNALEVEEE
jgi:hypothetical protein